MQKLDFNEERAKELFLKFKKDPILGNLSLARLFDLLETCPIVQYDPGEYIINEGESDTHLFILASGKMEIIHSDKIIKTMDRIGEIVGEMSLISKEARFASVRAVNQVQCLSIEFSYVNNPEPGPQNIMIYIISQFLVSRLKSNTKELADIKRENELLRKSNPEH